MARSLPAGFWRVFRRELRRIQARPNLAFMLGPFPLFLMLLLSVVFSAGLPRDLSVAVVDNDGTSLSRQAIRMVDATPDVTVTLQLANLAEGKQAIIRGDVYAVILFPENMERDLQSARQPEVVTFYNNQLLTIGGIVSRATRQALSTFSAGVSVRVLTSNGLTQEAALEAIRPIPLQQSPLFNPALDYTQFLLAALMPTVLLIFISAGAALNVARDLQQHNGARNLVRLGGSALPALAGKLTPYLLAFLLTLIFGDAILFGHFDAPFQGSMLLHVAYSLLFIASSLCLGAFIATVAGDTVAALGMTGVMTGPAFGFAGISFPRIMMNNFAWAWGGLLPLIPYLQLRVDQVLRGTPIETSLPTLGWLALQMLVYGGLALLLLKRKASRAEPSKEAAT
ncbi:ABC transporter permease [Shimia sp. R9_1]|uniref:ABC transporter permease n=1 Tax=Shimia sp. R9_1 TaxID=2821111 RepID=UPI001ADB1471|nr:ABC transporter permease [Shimia sp. R9_1]MBO9406673.1 ABC transporter permease [Shimia sp. R9_1]